MKSGGLIHPQLQRVIAELGHGHQLCIADCGLPIPAGVERIDLGYRIGAPGFLDVVTAMAAELVVERTIWANEAADHCVHFVEAVSSLFPGAVPVSMPHEALKAQLSQVRAVIRTGEATPYANVVLASGVPFA